MSVSRILQTARLTSWSYRILSTLVGLIVIRLINERIGLSGYGDVAFVLAYFTGVTAIDFGFLQALSRFVARYDDDKYSEKRTYFWPACLMACASLVGLQCLLLCAGAFALELMGRTQGLSLAELILMGIAMSVGTMLTAAGAIYAGFQRYGMAGLGKFARSISYLCVIVLLWATHEITMRSVLWSNVLTLLAAYALVPIFLISGPERQRMAWRWTEFPRKHIAELKDIASFSLNGWLQTLAMMLLTSGSVIAAGLVLPSHDVAKLQIVLVLYTGLAAFATGAMAPLTTISARHSDKSPESRRRISETARTLVDETNVLAAALVVFFVNYGTAVLTLLLGSGAEERTAASQMQPLLLMAVLPGLVALPFFVFRFALVGDEQNAQYSKQSALACVTSLGVGLAASAATSSPTGIAAGIGIALALRAQLAYHLGKTSLPGINPFRLALPLAATVLLFEVFSLSLAQLPVNAWTDRISAIHAQAALYAAVCALVYRYRRRLRFLVGLRLPASD